MRKINFILLLILLFFACSPSVISQWTKVNLSDSLYYQQFGAKDLVECNGEFFVLAGGGIYGSSDEGNNWLLRSNGMSQQDLYSNGKILFIRCVDGSYRSTDNGSTWINLDLPSQTTILSFASNTTQIFIGTDAGIFCSTDNGTNWIPRNGDFPKDNNGFLIIPAISLIIDGSKIYAGTLNKGIYVSTNKGNNWEPLNNGLPNDLGIPSLVPRVINMVSYGNAIFASISYNGVYRLLKGNDVWEKANTGILDTEIQSFVTKDSILYAVTTRAIYRTNDNGNNWKIVYNDSLLNSGSTIQVIVYGSYFYLGGVSFGIYESTDNGNTWISRNKGLGEVRQRYPLGIDAYNSTFGVSCNDNEVYISSDQGKSWKDLGKIFNEYSLKDTDLNQYAAGSNFVNLFGNYYIKKNNDVTWKQIYAHSSRFNWAYDLILVDTTLVAATYDGLSYTGYSNESIFNPHTGDNWEFSLTGLYCRTLSVNDNIIYAGTDEGIYLSTDVGKNWNLLGLKNKLISKLISKGKKILAYTDDVIYRSLDGGNTWSEFNIGLSNVKELALCGDSLFALTRIDYTNGTIWKNSFNEVITNIKNKETLPIDFSLCQNYPNPFNPTTTITYSVPKTSFVTIKVYNTLGRLIKTLVNDEKPASSYKIKFDGSNYASGIYFYRMQAGDFIETKKLILLK